ncbi:MAG: dTDP-glucose 4,6-dehydratase [Acidimicrobiales bacterium]
MRLLVTGGAGFIGSNFVRYWVREHPSDHVVVYDALTYAGNPSNLDGLAHPVELVEADIVDQERVQVALGDHRIEAVVHFAAESHNSRAALDPGAFFFTNVLGTQRLLEACRRHGVQRFHHVSTCEVYGQMSLDEKAGFVEESPYRPRTPYSASKAGADHAVRAYLETYDLPVTITNCANNYGPFQFPEKLVALLATRALDDRPLPLYASLENRREWLHVSDHCKAIEIVMEKGRIGETYLVGSGIEASIAQIADLVLDAAGKPQSLKRIVTDRPGHDTRYLLDSSKLRSELGWLPEVELKEGIAQTVEWYREHRGWWEPLIEGALPDEHAWATAARGR